MMMMISVLRVRNKHILQYLFRIRQTPEFELGSSNIEDTTMLPSFRSVHILIKYRFSNISLTYENGKGKEVKFDTVLLFNWKRRDPASQNSALIQGIARNELRARNCNQANISCRQLRARIYTPWSLLDLKSSCPMVQL